MTNAKINLAKSVKILNRDFYGLDKVKERILELISVYKIKPDVKGQIICLAGPPGVGKTHIGKSIAECMGRRYARVALGGVSDEAEMRGHRKTYIGAMPGRIIDAIKKAGSSNPVILLDEIDKLQEQNCWDRRVLRAKIIDAAIQGQLTEQLKEDGNAEQLLKDIYERKQALKKERNVKIPKNFGR